MSTKIRYELESKANQKGESLIHLIMSYGFKEYDPKTRKDKYQSLKISTQQSIRKEDWNGDAPTKKYTASKGKTLQNRIENLARICEHQLDLYINEHGELPNPKVLKGLIEVKIGRSEKASTDIRIIDHIESVIAANEKLPLGTTGRLDKKTTDKYKTIKDFVLAYEEAKKINLTISNLTKDVFFDIWDFANRKHIASGKNIHGYLVNTVSKNAGTLVTLLRKGDWSREKTALNLNDKNLSIKELKARDSEVFLTEEDLDRILNADTLSSKQFINARNYLTICSFTSLRYEDMDALLDVRIETYSQKDVEFEYFTTKIRKGKKDTEPIEVCIPVLGPVKQILLENNGRFPTFPENPTINRQIKLFGKHVGLNRLEKIENWYYGKNEVIIENEPLWSLLKCHLGRGTFVSNLIKAGLDESSFEFITHPERKLTTNQKYYDKRKSLEKAASLVLKLRGCNSKYYKC